MASYKRWTLSFDLALLLDYHLALEGKKTCVLRSHGTVIMGGTVLGWLPPSEHCTDSQLKYTLHFSEKEAYLLVQDLWPEKQASGLAGLGSCTQRMKACGLMTSALLQLNSISLKGIYILDWYPDFLATIRGSLHITWLRWPAELMFINSMYNQWRKSS